MLVIQEEIDKASTYPAYKPSNIDWIGEIPEHWNLFPLAYFADSEKYSFVDGPFGSDLKNEEYVSEGIPLIQLNNIGIGIHKLNNLVFITQEKSQQLHKHRIFTGDIAIAKMAEPVARATRVSNQFHMYVIVADCIRLKNDSNKIETDFLIYALNSDYLKTQAEFEATGTTRIRIGLNTAKKLRICYPPLPEQQAIVAYLDQKTALIDELIGKKQRKIDLLKEQRTALINHAVTKGLNPDVSFKDSGIEWIGEIPEHWGRKRIKQISKIISKGTTPSTVSRELLEDGEIRYLKAENISDNKVVPFPSFFIDNETDNILSRSKLFENDLLFVIAGATLGKVAILPKEFTPANTNQAVSFIRLKEGYNVNFAWYWLSSSILQEQIWIDAVQSAQPNLSMENLGNFHIPFPPLSEQQVIVAYLDEQTALVNNAIALETQKIDKLKEYRQSLISAAVTGKICVLPFTEKEETKAV
jgi:type I restriction enzyme S subunit